MNELEVLARELFYRYAADKDSAAYWERLPLNRKVAWMTEVLVSVQNVVKHLKVKIKPVATLGNGAASYEKGFNHGTISERLTLKTYLDEVENNYKKQLEEFIYVEEQRAKNK